MVQCTIYPMRLALITYNPGFVTHMCESLTELRLLSAAGLVDISPMVH